MVRTPIGFYPLLLQWLCSIYKYKCFTSTTNKHELDSIKSNRVRTIYRCSESAEFVYTAKNCNAIIQIHKHGYSENTLHVLFGSRCTRKHFGTSERTCIYINLSQVSIETNSNFLVHNARRLSWRFSSMNFVLYSRSKKLYKRTIFA